MKDVVHSKTVLVGVLKNRRDRRILLKEYWYRIPIAHLPKRKFEYIAFYQPLRFGKTGKRIEYYAPIFQKTVTRRIDLLPNESAHPRANDDYLRIEFKKIVKLPRPIKNIIPRRISFGFTSLKTLLAAKDILQLYGVVPTEKIIRRALERLGIQTIAEYTISENGRRYRLDFAVFCRQGRIAIECDNLKAHSSKTQLLKDQAKDKFLKSLGWRVVRLKEKDIIERLNFCADRISRLVKILGGQSPPSGLEESLKKTYTESVYGPNY